MCIRSWRFLTIVSHMSVMLGRPRSINASDCTIQTPFDCTFHTDPQKTLPTAIPSQDLNSPPSTYSPQIFQYSLSQKNSRVGSSRSSSTSYERLFIRHHQSS